MIVKNNMKCTLEIGVYRGRSLVPQALAHKRTGGLAIGIDPFRRSSAKELESPAEHAAEIDNWLESTDFDAVYALQMGLALLTAALCAMVDTRPAVRLS